MNLICGEKHQANSSYHLTTQMLPKWLYVLCFLYVNLLLEAKQNSELENIDMVLGMGTDIEHS